MDLVGIARNPIPSGAVAGAFSGRDGKKLRYACWPPTGPVRRGTICLFGGRTEFIEKYFEVIADLRLRGFAVATMDWRGQGGSVHLLKNKRKGHIDHFDTFNYDLAEFMRQVVLPDCPPPFFALAHSMGANILLSAARMRSNWFERMVLVSPMLQLAEVQLPFPQSLARSAAEVLSFFGLERTYVPGGSDLSLEEMGVFEDNPLTTDYDRFHRTAAILETAPELGLGAPTIGWLRAAYRSMRLVTSKEFPAKVQVPVLIFSAGNDRVVSTQAIEAFASRLKNGSHIVISGAEHEILQEKNEMRHQFWAAFDAFMLGNNGQT